VAEAYGALLTEEGEGGGSAGALPPAVDLEAVALQAQLRAVAERVSHYRASVPGAIAASTDAELTALRPALAAAAAAADAAGPGASPEGGADGGAAPQELYAQMTALFNKLPALRCARACTRAPGMPPRCRPQAAAAWWREGESCCRVPGWELPLQLQPSTRGPRPAPLRPHSPASAATDKTPPAARFPAPRPSAGRGWRRGRAGWRACWKPSNRSGRGRSRRPSRRRGAGAGRESKRAGTLGGGDRPQAAARRLGHARAALVQRMKGAQRAAAAAGRSLGSGR